jgi:hypothetical protein
MYLQILPGVSFFRLHSRPSIIRLQMRFDAWYIRQASRRYGGLGLLYCAFSAVASASCNGGFVGSSLPKQFQYLIFLIKATV